MRYLTLLVICILSIGFANATLDPTEEISSTPSLMSAGVANEVYLVNSSASEPHILKIFNRKSLEDLENSELLLQLVRNHARSHLSQKKIAKFLLPPNQVSSGILPIFGL